ncbi:hypothetical protein LPTSP4_25590 [Leptospira ryugenii]|uniref:HmuY protein n=1 Tax=Leptospira ryugenii TaxID=1917863 RepID=A0A2P2E2B3_9LEPT|nr:HmuY family protein [Leptospira ryugenii]GBF51028.1 hypothetical protein LPTSP4_25590 [Leptospira ryugenii]
MFVQKTFLFFPFFVISIIHCADSKKSSGADAALLLLQPSVSSSSNASGGISVETTYDGNFFTTTANASSSSEWVYVSLKSGGKKASSDIQWDIRFKRFVIGTNSGTSGTGSGGSCSTNSTEIGSTSINQSSCTLVSDSQQTQTGDGGFGNASESASPSLFTWYNYDSNTHILSSKRLVYVLRGSDGTFYKLQMLDYYSSAGTSGYMKFIWKGL